MVVLVLVVVGIIHPRIWVMHTKLTLQVFQCLIPTSMDHLQMTQFCTVQVQLIRGSIGQSADQVFLILTGESTRVINGSEMWAPTDTSALRKMYTQLLKKEHTVM